MNPSDDKIDEENPPSSAEKVVIGPPEQQGWSCKDDESKKETKETTIYTSDDESSFDSRSSENNERIKTKEKYDYLFPSTFMVNSVKKDENAVTGWTRRDAEQDQESIQQLHKAVEDAGKWAYGIIAVEVWALDETNGARLYPPAGGMWIDSLAHRGRCNSSTGCPVCRLTNPELSSYIPPSPVAIGEGLPGILWADSRGSDSKKSGTYRLHWHHIPDLVNDPHRQWNLRMQWWIECGITWAAGVPFRGHNHQRGIIIYLARSGIARNLLKSPENDDYLKAVSDQIASLYSVNSSRCYMIAKRRAERDIILRRVKVKILAVVRFGGNLKTLTDNNEKENRCKKGKDSEYGTFLSHFENAFHGSFNPTYWATLGGTLMHMFDSYRHQTSRMNFDSLWVSIKNCAKWAEQKVVVACKKSKGKGVEPPPLPPWDAAFLAGIGSFLTLLVLARLNAFLIWALGGEYSIILGPMGAFVTLLYGLTAAPAAQPLNSIVGQAMAMAISILISKSDNLEIYHKQSLATGLTVFIMVKLGLTHPPAGASALVCASGNFGWGNMAFTMLAVWIATFMGSFINNLHSKRQYPTFWGFTYVIKETGITKRSIKVAPAA